MKQLLTILFLCLIIYSDAQILTTKRGFRFRKKVSYANRNWDIPNGVYMSLNPLAIAEPRASAIGLGAAYRFKDRWELHNEFSILKESIYKDDDSKMKGFRNVFTVKYTIGNNSFIAVENRVKDYTFVSINNFYNATTKDTLLNFEHRAQHRILGFAFLYGQKLKLSANNKLQMELCIGFGGRQRTINRMGVSNGYVYNRIFYPSDGPTFIEYFETDNFIVYLPGALKIFYKL
jgi:hypothetical protein